MQPTDYRQYLPHALGALLVVLLLMNTFGTINAGERGIKTRFGAVVGTVEQGFYVKIPLIENVHKMDVKTRTISYDKNGNEGDAADTSQLFGASKDLQDVRIGVVVNYHVDPTRVADIFSQYQSVENFEYNVIEPIVREVVKSTAAQYTAEELVTKRTEVSDKVASILAARLAEKYTLLETSLITNFEYSQAFSQAIEAKVTATQNAEAAKNKLEQVKFEAQQTIEKARAEAESIRIQAQAINSQGGADYVQLKAIEKWNGTVPQTMIPNGSVPFIDLR